MNETSGPARAGDFDRQVELGLLLVVEHFQKVLPGLGGHRLAAGEDFRRRDRLLVADRAAADDDVAPAVELLEQQVHGAPAGDRAERVEAAGEGRLLMIAVGLERQPHHESVRPAVVDANPHLRTHRDFALQRRLQLAELRREDHGHGLGGHIGHDESMVIERATAH